MSTPLFGILMLLLTILLIGATIVALVVVKLHGRPIGELAAMIALALVGWCLLYGGALVGTSLTSEPRLLGHGQPKAFCGFYLDCHMHLAVTNVDTAHEIGPAGARVRATGVFYVVRVRVSSDARAASLRLLQPALTVRDTNGLIHARSLTAESALRATGGQVEPLDQTLEPGAQFVSTVVFDVPTGTRAVTLDATEGYWIDRILERVLIGDDDSLLHQRTLLRLAP